MSEKRYTQNKHGSKSLFDDAPGGGLHIVYPRGSTLSVQRPARAILSSGAMSYPLNRTICAAYQALRPTSQQKIKKIAQQQARIIAIGSTEIFSDEYVEKEDNSLFVDLLFGWLARASNIPDLTSMRSSSTTKKKNNGGQASPSAIDDPQISSFELSGETHYADELENDEYERVPDIEALASRLRCCLEEHEELARDFTQLFDLKLFGFDTNIIPELLKLYPKLNVKHEALTLIPPSFETPLPPLQPATFPPSIHEIPPPPLDQFDLDEHFASARDRLAQLTNKCLPCGDVANGTTALKTMVNIGNKSLNASLDTTTRGGDAALEHDDLEYYIREAGDVVGATSRMLMHPQWGTQYNQRSAKHILAFILKEVITFKMINPLNFDSSQQHSVNHTRRLGEEPRDDKYSAAALMAGEEPIQRRQQLSRLDPSQAKIDIDNDRPLTRGGRPSLGTIHSQAESKQEDHFVIAHDAK
eukprot:CAMPEP_0197320226 /NCGR_PEP_ID=MMETSP0891-20130614/58359_1 /TAXON_ID=44058 ORGANISM="Aureoumbra lagunensis, Strain CCMP1510" /NCGR_SAMPLE_ID=MMETSP0891 /ASSEMBLY_ACC=CAM_ASM_000534 /LENGTH=471 /DNA_ID=CAMNT_0042811499 /DNA_START=452 /DNA_END=1867 /DNA_ORIENTATION=-